MSIFESFNRLLRLQTNVMCISPTLRLFCLLLIWLIIGLSWFLYSTYICDTRFACSRWFSQADQISCSQSSKYVLVTFSKNQKLRGTIINEQGVKVGQFLGVRYANKPKVSQCPRE